MDLDFVLGQELLVELEEECFIGECHFISKDKTRLELRNVYDVASGEPVPGIQNFFKSDIKDIKITKNGAIYKSNGSHRSQNGYSHKPSKVDENIEQTNGETLFNTKKMQTIENMANQAVVIYQTDRHYHNAIKDIKEQNEVTLRVESCEMGRHSTTSIVSIYTGTNVYIFDIVYLGKVFPELKNILESEKPRKIIHNGSKVADNLKYNQDVELRGIFDTLVAYVAYTGNRKILDFNRCASTCLNVPQKFIVTSEAVDWFARPFDDQRKVLVAKRTILLHDLYQYLLHDCLLSNFYKECAIFSSSYYKDPDSVAAALNIAKEKNDSINEVNTIDSESWPIRNLSLES